MVENELIKSIFGWIGFTISIYFYLSPVVPFIKVVKGEIKYKDAPFILLLCNIMNCIMWIDYGLVKNTFLVYFTCAIGGAITLIWITIYLIFLGKKIFLICLLSNLLLMGLIFGITYLFYIINIEITGYAALVFNVLMLISPGEKIFTVIKTGKYELIPIFSTIGSLLNSGCWLLFGIFQNDLKLIIPNGLGLFFSIIQVLVYYIYYKKCKKELIYI